MSGYIFQTILYLCLKIFSILTTSVDPDEMQRFFAFHLCLHCLQKYSFRVSRIQRDKELIVFARFQFTPDKSILITTIAR